MNLQGNTMAGEYLSIFVPRDTIAQIRRMEGKKEGAVNQAVTLALLIDKGQVFQKVGKDFLEVSLRDVDPLPKPKSGDLSAEYCNVEMDSKLYFEQVKHKIGSPNEWLSRALALRLRAEEMHLYHFTGTSYEAISY